MKKNLTKQGHCSDFPGGLLFSWRPYPVERISISSPVSLSAAATATMAACIVVGGVILAAKEELARRRPPLQYVVPLLTGQWPQRQCPGSFLPREDHTRNQIYGSLTSPLLQASRSSASPAAQLLEEPI